jgi:hypothetical protein
VHVTPDGRTTLLNHRRMNGVLILLDWSEKRSRGGDLALAVARASEPGGR